MSLDCYRKPGCFWECEGPGKAQRMVNDAIVTAVKEVIAELEARDFTRAQSHISGLIKLLEGIPKSTAQLFETHKIEGLSNDLNRALQEVVEGQNALPTLQGIFLAWCGLSQDGPLTWVLM